MRSFATSRSSVKQQRNIPADLRARLPEVDWRGVAGFRDVLVHRYFDVDIDLTWQIIRERVTPLADAVAKCLATT